MKLPKITTIQSASLVCAIALLATGCFQQGPQQQDASAGTSVSPEATSASETPSASTSATTADGDMVGCIDPKTFDKEKDYFPNKVEFTEAKLVNIEYHKFYKTLKVTNPDTKAVQTAVLVQCGAQPPALEGDLVDAKVITVPADSIITPSTTEISNFELLGTLDNIGATGATEYISSAKALENFSKRNVPAIATQSGDLDAEKAISVKPDVVFMAGTPSDAFNVIEAAKIPVIDDNAWLEATPLARAEWLKFFAALTNSEEKANTEYGRIEQAYNDVKAKVASSGTKPTVLAGSSYEGKWYVPGNDSYVAKFIADAGGEYVFSDVPGGGSDPVDYEQVIAKGAQADIWINAQTSAPAWKTTADIIGADARLGELKAVKEGKVFNPMKRIGPVGGNEYWEMGVIEPDVVLHDLAASFHPDAFPGYETSYYLNVGK